MPPKIVIVGGGAAGLPLATRLGNTLGKRRQAEIILVDPQASHIWKPRFHELATGALDSDLDAINYRLHGVRHHYYFEQGAMQSLCRAEKVITLQAMLGDHGEEVLPERRVHYDYLVIALGSQIHDFGVQGVRDYCYCLDSRDQATRFRGEFVNLCMRANYHNQPLSIAIVGAGPTGVELSAALLNAVDQLKRYGLRYLNRTHLQVRIIEAAPRILGGLRDRVCDAVHAELTQLGITVSTDTTIKQVAPGCFTTADGEMIKADMLVWAAGVLAPSLLSDLDGLASNKVHQLLVGDSLQTTQDSAIFALGDCCALDNGQRIPPTAQLAQQMADHAIVALKKLLTNQPLPTFRFNDHGALISLSNYDSVGYISSVLGRGVFIEGWLAKRMYVWVYRLHQARLLGWPSMLLLLLAGRFNRLARPGLKLH